MDSPDGLFLWATLGPPGSGKSHFARTARKLASTKEVVLVSKDELRLMLHDGEWTKRNEKMTEAARDAIVDTALFEGRNVIVHDTNLAPVHLLDLERLAKLRAADFRVISFLDVPKEVCIERNAQRSGTGRLDESVIHRMFRDQLENGKRELLEKLIKDKGW